MKTYKHVAVPPGVDRNLDVLRAALSKRVTGCIFNATSCSIVSLAGCSDIACQNCICDRTHRDLLKEYLNKVEKENSMEEQIKAILKPGMVIRTVDGRFFLWIGGSREEAYLLDFRQGLVVLADCKSPFGEYDDVDAVYAYHTGEAPAVSVSSLVGLMQKKDNAYTRCVRKRPEPVKEMKVDEISKALGYKVKVVGNEKADS